MNSTGGDSMFVALLKYVKPLAEVERYLEEHIQFLDKYYEQKKFIFSGRRNPRTGGVILMKVSTVAEATQIMYEDPFYKHQIAEYDLVEFLPTKYDSRFSCFVD
jgi:uncharacterized protein YciI